MLKKITKEHFDFEGKHICLHSKEINDNILKHLKREFRVATIKQGDVTSYLVCKIEKSKKDKEK